MLSFGWSQLVCQLPGPLVPLIIIIIIIIAINTRKRILANINYYESAFFIS